jgi:hypothetical protein
MPPIGVINGSQSTRRQVATLVPNELSTKKVPEMAHNRRMTPEQESEAFRDWPEAEVCRLLASRVRRMRHSTGESQKAFADRAYVPLRTYKRFELEGRATLETFLQVLRALNRTQYLQLLFPSEAAKLSRSLDDMLERARVRSKGSSLPD